MELEYNYVNDIEMFQSAYFQDLLREKIGDTLYEERKKNEKLDKILFNMEIVKFKRFKDKKSISSETLTKLEEWVKLYFLIKENNKKNSDIKYYYDKYFDDVMIN